MIHFRSLIILLLSVIILSCADEYNCRCFNNSEIINTQGEIQGLFINPANIVASKSKSFRIVADNMAKSWDHISVKLFKGNKTFLETHMGTNFMSTVNSSVVIDIPISSLVNDKEPNLGEVEYTCNFILEDRSVYLKGSISVVTCQKFFEDFEADDCRWSCQTLQNGFVNDHCLYECP